jgi:polyisoprenoid-binding protein YceI
MGKPTEGGIPMRRFALAAAAALILLPVAVQAGWNLDPQQSAIRFKTTIYLVNPVNGGFDRFSGKVVYDEQDVTKSAAEITIDVASIHSGIGLRDKDLRGERFFDVAKFPTAHFRSKRVEKVPGGTLKVTGDLTMHGVTREVVLDVEGPTAPAKGADGKNHVSGKATTTISRKAFGMGGIIGSDAVELAIDISLIQADGP